MSTILLVAPKYNYGRESDGYSYEYYQFYDSLVRMGNDVALFDFLGTLHRYGRDEMNARLVRAVRDSSPDLLIAVPHRDELSSATLRTLSEDFTTQTLAWFSDDHWRFESHTQRFAPCFNWAVTTARNALPKYAAIGYENVIRSQWGCNQFMYRPIEAPLRYSVTFVGQPHGTRRSSIAAIRAAGIDVHVWGKGWPAGRVSQEQMLRLFCQSRINLNLANASPARTLRGRVMAVLWRAAGTELVSPALRRLFFNAIGPVERLLRPALPREVWDADFGKSLDQIKGRNFEVPGCAGFLLTGNADDLEQYYAPMREVATFDNMHTMIERLRYYLRNEDERVGVARAGYERTIREHTYVHRFTQIFERIGLKSHNPDDVLAGRVQPGVRTEI